MLRRTTRFSVLVATALTFTHGVLADGPAQSGAAKTTVPLPAATRTAITSATTSPVSDRVDASRVTTLPVPPLPARVVSPLPVVLRIAEQPTQIPLQAEHYAKALASIDRALAWLRTAQGPRGGWMEGSAAAGTDQARTSSAASLAVTALVLKAFAQRGSGIESDGAVSRGVDYLRSRAWPDGKFDPDPTGALGNYVAASITQAMAALGSSTRESMNDGVAWLMLNQWDQKHGIGPERDWFGGAGYGNGRRPDLSNTQVFLDALHDAGIPPTDPAVQKALVFVTRCQNMPEFNGAAWASDGTTDGGMVYSPANGGESMASAAAGEGRAGEKLPPGTARSLRSYGSMTYAGFKSLLYAGLTPDDPRVASALDWIRRHWTFDENPGMAQEGRYYYLHAMARALHASGMPVIVDAKGTSHRWREELIDAILALQQPDGHFRNSAERWMEANPELATAYLVLALEEALKPTLTVEP